MNNRPRTKKAFTLVEMLTTISIIAILIALLVPSLSMIRRFSKETAQKSQFASLDMAIEAFKSDYGDYPPSYVDTRFGVGKYYCGAQKLTEALVGWDLLGFHPQSDWRYDGLDSAGNVLYSDPNGLNVRKGPYLELATTNVFRLGNISTAKPGLFNSTGNLAPDTFVLCDVFKVKKIIIGPNKAVNAGTPVLYYRANTSSKVLDPNNLVLADNIYNVVDNAVLVGLGRMTDGTGHSLGTTFYNYDYKGGIRDPKVTTRSWPYRPDSYILISAGMDGLYGTSDDIHNF